MVFANQEREAMVFVETLGCFVLDVHNHCENAKLGSRDADYRICQNGGAESLALMTPAYRKPTK